MSQIQIGNYILQSHIVLGKGSTGTVYLGYDIHQGTKVAIKVIQLKNITNQVTQYLLKNEVKALQITNHPHLLHAYDVISDPHCCYVVTTYCPNKTLDDYIKSRGRVPEREALGIFRKIVEGYASLLEQNIFHRDLKPTNVLFSEMNQPVIADFGYCEIAGFLPKPSLFYNVGSPAYMAPESITNNQYSEASQVWSLGTIFYEMLQGVSFVNGREVMEAIMQIKRVGPYVPDGASEISKRIVRECMMLRPRERITVKDLLGILNSIQLQYQQPRSGYQQFQPAMIQSHPNPSRPLSNYQLNQQQLFLLQQQQQQQLLLQQQQQHEQQQMYLYQQQLMLQQQIHQMQSQRPPSVAPQYLVPSSSLPTIQMGASVHEEHPPMLNSGSQFRPVSSHLGINVGASLVDSRQIKVNVDPNQISRPEVFPEYVPRVTSSYVENGSENLVNRSKRQEMLMNIPAMRSQNNQLMNLQNVQQQQPVIGVPVVFPVINSNTQVMNSKMMNSKRPVGSNYIPNEQMLNSVNSHMTGSSSKNTGFQMMFVKKPKNKVHFANNYTQNSRNLLELQQIKPSQMLSGLYRSKKTIPILRSLQKRSHREISPQVQPITPFGRPASNFIPNNQYYMSPAINQRI